VQAGTRRRGDPVGWVQRRGPGQGMGTGLWGTGLGTGWGSGRRGQEGGSRGGRQGPGVGPGGQWGQGAGVRHLGRGASPEAGGAGADLTACRTPVGAGGLMEGLRNSQLAARSAVRAFPSPLNVAPPRSTTALVAMATDPGPKPAGPRPPAQAFRPQRKALGESQAWGCGAARAASQGHPHPPWPGLLLDAERQIFLPLPPHAEAPLGPGGPGTPWAH
jgi:hypothetical protein